MNSQPIQPTALITGASAGIGAAMARQLASEGMNLILTARREDRLQLLADELRKAHGTHTTILTADLSLPEAVARLCEEIHELDLTVDWLVNNAGYGVGGSYLSNDWATHQRFLQVMVTSVAELTHRLLPGMRQRNFGRVVNIASLAALVPSSAGHTLYGAVKSWMVKFSESLNEEMREHGVAVVAVCPGFTYSEFHDVAGTRDQVNQMPGYMWKTSEEVARESVVAARRGGSIYITGLYNRMIALMVRFLPRSLMINLIRSRSKNFRDAH